MVGLKDKGVNCELPKNKGGKLFFLQNLIYNKTRVAKTKNYLMSPLNGGGFLQACKLQVWDLHACELPAQLNDRKRYLLKTMLFQIRS